MKKDMINFINSLKEPKSYIIVTDEGYTHDADASKFLALLTMIVKENSDAFSKEIFYKVVDMAFKMNDKPEFDEEIDELLKELDKISKILKELKDE